MKKQIKIGTPLQNALNTALIECAQNELECKDVAEKLLEAKANIEATNQYGSTALTLAAESGHSETVKLLLEHKANVEAANKYGSTALIHAAYQGHSSAAELLLKQKANIEGANKNGETALRCATGKGHKDPETRCKV